MKKLTLMITLLVMFAGLIIISCLNDESPTDSQNSPPVIQSLTVNPSSIIPGGTTIITCSAIDSDQENLTYSWSAVTGTFIGETIFSIVQ